MKIKSLKLKNFRNYDILNLDFDDSTNIFYGNNAQGKTNILESVYLCGTTKSHRGTKDRDMILFGQDEAHIEAFIEKEKKQLSGDFCRGCGYCMPCPAGIEINNCARMSLMIRRAPSAAWLDEAGQARMNKIDGCIGCNKCMFVISR